MALAGCGHDAVGAEQEQESPQGGFVVGKLFGVESFVGLLVGALVIEPGLADRGDDDPVAGQIDGVAVALIDGRHSPAGEGPVERIARALAFDGHDVALLAVEVAQHGVGIFAVDLDVPLAADRVAVVAGRAACSRAGRRRNRPGSRAGFLARRSGRAGRSRSGRPNGSSFAESTAGNGKPDRCERSTSGRKSGLASTGTGEPRLIDEFCSADSTKPQGAAPVPGSGGPMRTLAPRLLFRQIRSPSRPPGGKGGVESFISTSSNSAARDKSGFRVEPALA